MPKKRRVDLYNLSRIWGEYAQFKKGQIAESTYQQDYKRIAKRLIELRKVLPPLQTAISVRDWLLENYSAETTRRTIVQLNACCEWAVESEILINNPFKGMQTQIKPIVNVAGQYAAFTTQERDRIIQAFERDRPYYAPWVKFLFWTGCRPEEAAALKWEHVSSDLTEIMFMVSHRSDMADPQPTKNGKVTRFPCNERLSRLIAEMQSPSVDRQSLIFQARTGHRFNYSNFQTRHWKPIVLDLVSSGVVAMYLSQYHARHTWITEALKHLPVADVSYLSRVSVKVLYEHYAGRSRQITIPEF